MFLPLIMIARHLNHVTVVVTPALTHPLQISSSLVANIVVPPLPTFASLTWCTLPKATLPCCGFI